MVDLGFFSALRVLYRLRPAVPPPRLTQIQSATGGRSKKTQPSKEDNYGLIFDRFILCRAGTVYIPTSLINPSCPVASLSAEVTCPAGVMPWDDEPAGTGVGAAAPRSPWAVSHPSAGPGIGKICQVFGPRKGQQPSGLGEWILRSSGAVLGEEPAAGGGSGPGLPSRGTGSVPSACRVRAVSCGAAELFPQEGEGKKHGFGLTATAGAVGRRAGVSQAAGTTRD